MAFDLKSNLDKYNIKINFIRKMVHGLVNSKVRGLVISGAPGIGKTYTVTNTLEQIKLNNNKLTVNVSKGYITPYRLFQLMHKFPGEDSILVFDDCDSVLDNVAALNLLKAATEFSKVRTVMWNSSANLDPSMSNKFEFKGKIIVLTNKRLNSNPHYQAFIDRIHYYHMEVPFEQRLAKIVDISDKLSEVTGETNYWDIIEYLVKHKESINQDRFSIRNFIKLVEMKSLFADEWVNYLHVMNSVIDFVEDKGTLNEQSKQVTT